MPLAPAFRLGPYEVVELLSAGSMGEVYRARDTRLGRDIAVKILPPAFARDPDRLFRFRQEAQAAGLLNHPNIVAIYDVGTQDDISFVVSELVDGETLRTALRAGALPLITALEYAAQLARGLSVAHGKGVVHRDLKPENVMVTRDGRVKIVDFGIAKLDPTMGDRSTAGTGQATLPGTLVGTIAYMSPEQVRGEEVDERSDIFSLGVILYEMLAGRHPFMRATGADTIGAILRDEPAPVGKGDHAERIEALVRQALAKRRDDRFRSASAIAQTIERLYHDIQLGAARSSAGWSSAQASDARTIAVLPFANMNADAESEYFSDGLTEELIQALTLVRGVQVVAWHSAAQLKGRDSDPREVGRQLDVHTVLTGSVRKAGDRIRVAARLMEVSTGYYLWSDGYDRQLADVFRIQEEIARAIVATLTPALRDGRQLDIGSRRSTSVEAYNLYLRGRFFLNKRTEEGLRRSVECFERAIEIDEHFAVAHSGLADALCLLADYGIGRPNDVMPRARQAAIRALELDPRSAEAHTSFALIRSVYDREWFEAEALYRRAIELGPAYATAHHWLAIDFLAMVGRLDEASVEIEIASELDPLSLIIQEGGAYLAMLARHYDEAIVAYQALIDLEPSFYKFHTSMGRVLMQMGLYREAISELEKGLAMAGEVPNILGALGQAHALAGDVDAARRLLGQLNALAAERHVPSTTLALTHLGLGERDKALEWLERGCEQREFPLSALKVHPAYDPLRGEPRFRELLRLMRFPD